MVKTSSGIWGRGMANSGNTQDSAIHLWKISHGIFEYKHLGNGDLSLNNELKSLLAASASRRSWTVLK